MQTALKRQHNLFNIVDHFMGQNIELSNTKMYGNPTESVMQK